MNEKIKELAKQAGYQHSDAVGRCEDFAYFDLEEFTKLLVSECITVINSENYLEHSMGWNTAIAWSTKSILEHFEVEP